MGVSPMHSKDMAETPMLRGKIPFLCHRRSQPFQIFVHRNLNTSEAFEMRRTRLRIEQLELLCAQTIDQMHQRHLTRVALGVKHALAKKRRAERHAIQPADELFVLPSLDAVGKTH